MSGVYRIEINGWHPTPLNRLLNAHWATRNRLKRADSLQVGAGVVLAGVPKAQAKRRVSLEIALGPRQRGCDPDAYLKSLLDSLVKSGALVNDSHIWCELGSVTFCRGEGPATVIILEDMN